MNKVTAKDHYFQSKIQKNNNFNSLFCLIYKSSWVFKNKKLILLMEDIRYLVKKEGLKLEESFWVEKPVRDLFL